MADQGVHPAGEIPMPASAPAPAPVDTARASNPSSTTKPSDENAEQISEAPVVPHTSPLPHDSAPNSVPAETKTDHKPNSVQETTTASSSPEAIQTRRLKFPPPLDRALLKSLSISATDTAHNKRWYAGLNYNDGPSCGLSTILSRFRPKVERRDFSLIQTAVPNNHPSHPLQTIEAGWKRDGGGVVQLFVFFTTTGYDSWGAGKTDYAQDSPDWIPLIPDSFTRGVGFKFLPASHIDGPQEDLTLQWQLVKKSPFLVDGWYLYMNDAWIGYYPLSLFTATPPAVTQGPDTGKTWDPLDPSNTLADHATLLQVYGEVYDADYDRGKSDPGTPTSTDMGSGKFPVEGFGKAAFIRNIMRLPKPMWGQSSWEDARVDNWKLTKGDVFDKVKYDIQFNPLTPTKFRSFCYIGGTGKALEPGKWSEWDNVSAAASAGGGNQFVGGSSVTAVQRSGAVTDLFLIGADGRQRRMAGLGRDGGIRSAVLTRGKIAGCARMEKNLDLFGVGNDGKVYTAWWVEGQDWTGWRDITGSSRTFPANAPMTVVSRAEKQLDIFVNDNGTIRTAFWANDGNPDWTSVKPGWQEIGSPVGFQARSEILAVSRNSDTMEVAMVGNNGRVYVYGFLSGSTNPPAFRSVGTRPPGMSGDPPAPTGFPAGSKVAGVSRSPELLNLLVVDKGAIWTSSWEKGKGWSGVGRDADGNNKFWDQLGSISDGTPSSVFDAVQSDIVALTRRNHTKPNMDVIITGTSGKVYRIAWDNTKGQWGGLANGNRDFDVGGVISDQKKSPTGFRIGVASREVFGLTVLAADQFEVVFVMEYEGP
ncbi:hypothetical protein FGG08_003956 [Glutinoglossum americanum]|uniref:Neprosin PEP catalytic domain-containing protein n=1 Tax=Glutinoglossum americanum TaxID=1670608 RepID=A0A9P8I1N2_9PEZI|nr:hypothetical protein FGG08_003956 [Glutinoglossum americanum]